MHPCAERRPRINMDDHLILILRRNLLPGRNDQHIVNGKLIKILLPVINPVHILCLGLFNLCLSHVHISPDLRKLLLYSGKHRLLIFLHIQIETDIGGSVVLPELRKDIYKHLCLLLRRKGYFILNLHSLNPKLHQTAADHVLCLRSSLDSEFIPFHTLHLIKSVPKAKFF